MTKRKIDISMIEQAKAMRLKGEKQERIAVELGVSQGSISGILRAAKLGGQLAKAQKAG